MGNAPALQGSKIRFGHRVLEITPGSPSAEAMLVPYLDVIVAINDTPLVRRVPRLLARLISRFSYGIG